MKLEKLEAQLEHRALKEGWDIPHHKRTEVIAKTIERATCGIPDVEEAATRTLIAMDAVQLKKESFEQKKREMEHARKLQLIEAAVKLGLVSDVGTRAGAIPNIESSSNVK
jgi:hypothetical protein